MCRIYINITCRLIHLWTYSGYYPIIELEYLVSRQEIGARLCTISCLDYDLNKVSVTLHLTFTLLLRPLSSVTSEWLIGVCPSNNVANCLSPWIHVYSSVSNPLGLGDTRCWRREREYRRCFEMIIERYNDIHLILSSKGNWSRYGGKNEVRVGWGND